MRVCLMIEGQEDRPPGSSGSPWPGPVRTTGWDCSAPTTTGPSWACPGAARWTPGPPWPGWPPGPAASGWALVSPATFPAPVGPGQDGGHGRPHLRWPGRARARRRLARGRAPRLRLRVPADPGPHGAAGRAAGDRLALLRRGLLVQGRHYQLQDLRALPKPVQRPRPTLLVGGAARPGAWPYLAARWADEYNTTGLALDELPERRRRQQEAWQEAATGVGPAVAHGHLRGRPGPGRGHRAGRAGPGRDRQPRQRGRGARRPAQLAARHRRRAGRAVRVPWRRPGSAGSCSSTWTTPTPTWSRCSERSLLP